MERARRIFWLLLVYIAAVIIPYAGCQSEGICYMAEVSYRAVSRSAYRVAYQTAHGSHSCGHFGWSRCSHTYSASYRQFYISYYPAVSYSVVSRCCSGYEGEPPLCQAICPGGCLNGGTCSSPGVCTCAPGWAGNNCEQDIDECNGPHGCEQTCDNTDGSYQCSCDDGYELTSNGHNCTDIGECLLGTHNCPQVCVELLGGFKCDCYSGYDLQEDGVSCNDINECSLGTAGCNHGCSNTEGRFMCTCNDGYQLHHEDLTACVDIDECDESNGSCQHNCTNTIGSFYCSCNAGYLLDKNGYTCTATDTDSQDGDDSLLGSGLPWFAEVGIGIILVAIVLASAVLAIVMWMILMYKRYKRRRNRRVHPIIQVQPAIIEIKELRQELHQATEELRQAREQLAKQNEHSALPSKPECSPEIFTVKKSDYAESQHTRSNNTGHSSAKSTRTVYSNYSNDAESVDA